MSETPTGTAIDAEERKKTSERLFVAYHFSGNAGSGIGRCFVNAGPPSSMDEVEQIEAAIKRNNVSRGRFASDVTIVLTWWTEFRRPTPAETP